MQLDQRVNVLEEKVTDLQIEHAEMKTTLSATVNNLEKLSAIVLAEQQMFKLVTSFLLKYSPHIMTAIVAFGGAAYYAGVHNLII